MHYKAKALNPAYAGTDGRLNRDIILQKQPTLEEPLSRGVPAVVYRQELEIAIPVLPGFLSECANIGAGAAKLDTLTQTMFKANTRVGMILDKGGSVDPGVLGKQIEQHKPWLVGEGKGIIEFVMQPKSAKGGKGGSERHPAAKKGGTGGSGPAAKKPKNE